MPVAATESIIAMREEADDVVCLEDYVFAAIGAFYQDFRQITDEEVIETLKAFPPKTWPGRRP